MAPRLSVGSQMPATALAALALCLLSADVVEAGRGNDVCCTDPECVLKAYGPEDPNACCGAVGIACEGVSQTLCDDLGWDVTVVSVTENPDDSSLVDAPVSVGSILHDLCCSDHPYGAFCNAKNQPYGATLAATGDGPENDCACMLEWRKAAFNVLRNRQWISTFPKAQSSWSCRNVPPTEQDPPDQQNELVDAWTAKTYLPLSVAGGYESQVGAYQHRSATVNLRAPEGTALDCPEEDEACHVNYVPWTKDCFPISCLRRNWWGSCRTWSEPVEQPCASAGDAGWCASGKFASVHYSFGARWGVCK